MIGGVHGKILHVDLTNGETRVEQPPSELFELLVGGRALTAYLLLRDLPPNCDPLGPENRLIFAPGIMQGTNFPGAGRHGVGGKSPLTGALASSEAGGWWGHEFKRTGYDALVISGKAKKPVYLWIHNDKVEIRDAVHLWGQKTAPVQAAIHEELDNHKVRVAQIGPAGENLVKYAAVMHDINRAAGRNGVGALMGSKNLKAIAVRGTTKVPVGKRKQVTGVAKWLGDNYKTKAAWATAGIGRGTQDGLVGLSYVGGLPTNNFSEPVFEDPELLGGERNYEMFLKDRDTCQSCPITCKQVFEYESDNPYQKIDPTYGGPEYEAMAALGSNCGVHDNIAVCKANELCNALGMDAISAGASVAFAMECYAHGLLTMEDTGGLEFKWGDGDLLVRSMEMIAQREGFGDVLAEGVHRMSQKYGPETEHCSIRP
jgi:aldehyde:ferredoxin oxidoreductase